MADTETSCALTAAGNPCRADIKTLRRSVLWPKPVIGPLVGCDTSPDADVPF